jgi:hypothetical protein
MLVADAEQRFRVHSCAGIDALVALALCRSLPTLGQRALA